MVILKRGMSEVKQAVGSIREELDEHLAAINENTDEIASNYSYFQKLDKRIEQMSERLERIEMLLEGKSRNPKIESLSVPEKQVFLMMYTESKLLTYKDIADKIGYSEASVKNHVAGLIEKGVPIIKSYFNGAPFLKLNDKFREVQAKENVLNLSLQSFV